MGNSITFHKNSTDNHHYRELRKHICKVLKGLPKQRRYFKVAATFFLLGLYFSIYCLSIYSVDQSLIYYLLFGFLGIISVCIFINIIHDAVHNNIFNKRWANEIIIHVFDLMGGNSFIWKKRHILLHHNYQNISGWDSDIEQAGLIKIFPNEKPTLINRNQHWLIFIIYPLYLTNWVMIRDFKDFFSKNRLIRKVCDIPIKEYFKLIFFKLFFFFNFIIVPISLGASLSQALLSVFIMFTSGSIFALLVLLTPHVNEKNKFPVPDKNGSIPMSWLEHQFMTTNDIKLNNWFVRNFMGNFNFHLAHHLFPLFSSVYAPEITQVIKQYAEVNNLTYRAYSLQKALISHYQLIKANAIEMDFFEEDM